MKHLAMLCDMGYATRVRFQDRAREPKERKRGHEPQDMGRGGRQCGDSDSLTLTFSSAAPRWGRAAIVFCNTVLQLVAKWIIDAIYFNSEYVCKPSNLRLVRFDVKRRWRARHSRTVT